jgi:uncharacterized protein (UPF0261 family)
MHSVVDILGLNTVSMSVFDNAAGAITGMATAYAYSSRHTRETGRKAIAATMLGNTTRPLMHIKADVEAAGYDFVIFHANGVGGPAMEELIAEDAFAGVLDYTLSEVAGQIAGGFHIGGPHRLDAAAEAGIPQVIVPCCLDFVVFGAKHEVPESYNGRPTYYHNPEFTLVRVTHDEQIAAAEFVVEKLNKARGLVSVLMPMGGGSIMEVAGGDFWEPETLQACADVFRNGLNENARYREIDAHINDEAFAEAALKELLSLLSV